MTPTPCRYHGHGWSHECLHCRLARLLDLMRRLVWPRSASDYLEAKHCGQQLLEQLEQLPEEEAST